MEDPEFIERCRRAWRFWMRLCGAILKYCPDMLEWLVIYWRPFCVIYNAVKRALSKKPMDILAGFMSQNRGIHWNRYSKLKSN
jgi:hypothetical protein